MTADDYAGKAFRLYHGVNPDVDLRDCIASVIREAQAATLGSVLSIISEHQMHDTTAFLDELKEEIQALDESGKTARPI